VAKQFEPDDPLELVGVSLAADEGALDEMARCLVEDYVRDGWDADRLLALFRDPFYGTLHVIYRQRGEDYVRGLITQIVARWGVWRITEQEGPDA